MHGFDASPSDGLDLHSCIEPYQGLSLIDPSVQKMVLSCSPSLGIQSTVAVPHSAMLGLWRDITRNCPWC